MKFSFVQLTLFNLCFYLMAGCKDATEATSIQYFESGASVKEMTLFVGSEKGSKTKLELYEGGQIKAIRRLNPEGKQDGEQLFFYPSGILKNKAPMSKGIAQGNTYYFFDSTGALKHFRYFKDDKETLYGSDFWGDSIDMVKSSLHFNDSGHIYYKKNFDTNGRLISEEGNRQ